VTSLRILAIALALVALALVAAACSPSVTISPRPSTAGSPSTGPRPSLTAVPGGLSSPVAGGSIQLPTITETEFGRIWDALPPSFPVPPGSIRTDSIGGPASGSFAVGMSVDDAVRTMATALTNLGWTADAATPLEDGTVVLEAGGPREGCAAEVRFTPLSGTVNLSVLYGAECPFN
jgi:hypothetical protein